MASFTDKNGRDWQINFTVGLVKQIKHTLSVDLLKFDSKILADMMADPITFIDVIWLCVEEQAEAYHADDERIRAAENERRRLASPPLPELPPPLPDRLDERFAYCLDADAVEGAGEALIVALIDFFPSARRPALKALWERTQRAHQRACDLTTKKISEGTKFGQLEDQLIVNLDRDIDQNIDQAISETNGTSSGKSPESPDSTRTH